MCDFIVLTFPSTSRPGGEDSFFGFMSRMMEQYMKEEEVRSRHRALLLQLREKALKVQMFLLGGGGGGGMKGWSNIHEEKKLKV